MLTRCLILLHAVYTAGIEIEMEQRGSESCVIAKGVGTSRAN